MRSPFFALIAFLSLFAAVMAVKQTQKSYVVSFPNSTPDDIVDSAKKVITDAGGFITHSYKIIKAFAATVPEKGIDTLRSQSVDDKFKPTVEEDQVISVA